MSQYRLHIDVPLGINQKEAIGLANLFMNNIAVNIKATDWFQKLNSDIQFRLGNDDDRQRSNYLDINSNGHVSTRKFKL